MLAANMSETSLFLVTGCLLLAAILIPVPPRGRTVLWVVMLGFIVTLWVGVSLGDLAPLENRPAVQAAPPSTG
jgi:hypothetical protein